jgi:hypothetical protein
VPTLRLAIDAELCGPISIGTVKVIRMLSRHLGVSLREANAVVDRCVFEGEAVDVATSRDKAEELISALRQLPENPRVRVELNDS